MKKPQKARFLSPTSPKIIATKEKKRRKRKNEEKESKGGEGKKAIMVALLVFIIATLEKKLLDAKRSFSAS